MDSKIFANFNYSRSYCSLTYNHACCFCNIYAICRIFNFKYFGKSTNRLYRNNSTCWSWIIFLAVVLGTGVASFFYHYFESYLGKNFDGLTNGLSWIHLILTNIGISSASLTMIYAGYIGDLAIFPKEIGGFGITAMQSSQILMNQFIVPVGAMLLVAAIGAICGGLGFIITFVKR